MQALGPGALVEIRGPAIDGMESVLTPEALAFLLELHERFTPRLHELLADRRERQAEYDAGILPDFDPLTAEVRAEEWGVAPIPAEILDRRVEITGPAERKMIINALNSGAKVFMADLEDSLSPTFENIINAQIDLRDAVRGSISYVSPEGQEYRLDPDPAILMVRPRGLHLPEKHLCVAGEPLPAALVDFALYAFHNLEARLEHNKPLYVYLPKLEHSQEAEWWADVFQHVEDRLEAHRGAIKATVLIETLPAVFQMDEILYALRSHAVGLNCGRWDYIFSYIKTFRAHPERVLPDRQQVTMMQPFLRAYSQLLIRTCHRRGAFAMGGMAAQIPIRDDDEANDKALAAVRADKEREAGDGHDGTWVAHPALVPVALEVFERKLHGPNQVDVDRYDVRVTSNDLREAPRGDITLEGVCGNVCVALDYIAAWLSGKGCVPLNHLMEDAATAEIARAQLWQWLHHPKGVTRDGRRITESLLDGFIEHVLRERLRTPAVAGVEANHYIDAAALLRELTFAPELADFLTLSAYERL
ncbi:MAG TPA: malate synthase A [Gammaproteobacteria bacterium]|nr:malate synthase A [Gammaproteobacteria bacterium]